MTAKHSSVVGGSSADRVLNCPASVLTLIGLPKTVDVTSVYAEEGTHLHHVMDHLMRLRQGDNDIDLYLHAKQCIGKHFYDRELSTTLHETAIVPALDALSELEAIYTPKPARVLKPKNGKGAKTTTKIKRAFRVVGVEQRVRFPGIPGAFGTGDLFLESDEYLILNDWKFGQGVPVKAVYHLDDGELVNAQLLFYMTAARNTLPKLFAGQKKLVVAITQPRTDEPLTHTVVDRKELTHFAEDLENAVVEAFERGARRTKGEWCRFAACKIACPLWTGPLLDLSAIGHVREKTGDASKPVVTEYGQYLANAKQLMDMLIVFKPTLDEQMHTFLENGGVIPGWYLKHKTKNRAWIDEAVVEPALKKLGFKPDDIWQKKLQTFTHVDATAKRLGVVIPENLRVAPPTNETTIAAEGDGAPKVERAQAVANFTDALRKLTKQETGT